MTPPSIQHHGSLRCTPFFDTRAPIELSVLSGHSGPEGNKPDVTIQIYDSIKVTFDLTPNDARALAVLLLTAADAHDAPIATVISSATTMEPAPCYP